MIPSPHSNGPLLLHPADHSRAVMKFHHSHAANLSHGAHNLTQESAKHVGGLASAPMASTVYSRKNVASSTRKRSPARPSLPKPSRITLASGCRSGLSDYPGAFILELANYLDNLPLIRINAGRELTPSFA